MWCVVRAFRWNTLREEGRAGRMSAQMMAIVAEGEQERIFVSPDEMQETVASHAIPAWSPNAMLPDEAMGFRIQNYGLNSWGSVFSDRQTMALDTFAGLSKALPQGMEFNYRSALATYLAFGVSKSSDYWSNLCVWRSDPKTSASATYSFAMHSAWCGTIARPTYLAIPLEGGTLH